MYLKQQGRGYICDRTIHMRRSCPDLQGFAEDAAKKRVDNPLSGDCCDVILPNEELKRRIEDK